MALRVRTVIAPMVPLRDADPIALYVAADDPIVRRALVSAMSSERGVVVHGQGAADSQALALASELGAHVVVWDLGPAPRAGMERLGGLDASQMGVIVLTDDPSLTADVLGMGARGLLPRDASNAHWAEAACAVARGWVVADPELLSAGLRAKTGPRPSDDLTSRESEVLQLLAAGLANKVIAQKLNISEHTVKFHVNAILGKLDVQSRTEAVVRAARLGLVAL